MLKKRVQAFTIDMFIVVLANYALMTSFTQFVKTIFFYFPIRTQLFLIQKLNMINSVSLLSIMFAYFSIFYFVTNGKTFGKMIFGLTVKSSHAEMTLTESMKRSFSYLLCAMTGSFLFALPYFRKDKKSLADLFSKTSVGTEDEKSEVKIDLLENYEEDQAA